MSYETSNQHPINGDFGSVELANVIPEDFTFTAECDQCPWVGVHRASREQAADDYDEHMEVTHA